MIARHIKIKGKWIDTLVELRDNKKCYMMLNKKVHVIELNSDKEYDVGKLEDSHD